MKCFEYIWEHGNYEEDGVGWLWLSLMDALEKYSRKLRIMNLHLKAKREFSDSPLVASKRLSSSAAKGREIEA